MTVSYVQDYRDPKTDGKNNCPSADPFDLRGSKIEVICNLWGETPEEAAEYADPKYRSMGVLD